MNRNRIVLFLLVLMASALVCIPAASQNDISIHIADSLLTWASEPDSAEAMLKILEDRSSTDEQKCDIHWRMARVLTVKGESSTDPETRKAFYTQGYEYASAAIREDSFDPQGYMWHSACIGRIYQMKTLIKQAAVVPIIMGDLTCIIDTIGAVTCSEAWQGLSELYYRHPFKSDDCAINFMRQSLRTVPDNELRLSSYLFMVKMLHERNLSAGKRTDVIISNATRYRKSSTDMERYSFLDGKLGPSHIPAWSSLPLGSLSDREEAMDILNYAIKLYDNAAVHSPADDEDYISLKAALSSFKK